jgi:hypothetical protein
MFVPSLSWQTFRALLLYQMASHKRRFRTSAINSSTGAVAFPPAASRSTSVVSAFAMSSGPSIEYSISESRVSRIACRKRLLF